MSSILPTQAYELKLAPHPAPMSVLRFAGRDAVSELYRYDIEFTSPVAGIPMSQVIGRPARFVVSPVDPDMGYLRRMFGENAEQFSKMPPAYTIHGVITEFDEFATSADQTHYRVRLEPKLADLNRGVTSRLFQMQSVEEIVTSTLRHFGYQAGVDFAFKLRHAYKRHEYVTQYHETTFAFIQRLCAQEGIWFRWEQKKHRSVIVFGDDLDAYARKQRTVPYRRDSGLDSAGMDAVKTLEKRTRRVPKAVRLHDYNHREASVSLLVEENAARADKTTDGIDYRWGEHYATIDEGKRIARLRHEQYLANQIVFKGTGNPFWLEAGEVMRVDPTQADAKHGIFITSVESSGSRAQAYWLSFEGIASDRVWRPSMAATPRPTIDGILPARVTSPGNYKYAYLTEQGWYVIKLPFDLDAWSPGGTSRPVRFAKPYSGRHYGHHFPLIDGAEVAVVFTDGHPDRPVIIGAMHDEQHPDLINNLSHTRNIIRTAARNEMRMEDKENVEHIHLTTPYQTSELNLGHMVDPQRKARGQGAELRTDGHLAARGPRGMLLTAEAQIGASGDQLEMNGAKAQLERAIERMESLTAAVEAAEATVAELKQQKALYADALDGLKRAAILVSAPSGIGLTSGEHLHVNADRNLIATAGGNFDVGTMRNFTVAAGRQVSLFAQAQGMRLIAAKQDVTVQARTGAMALAASKDLHLSSVDGSIVAASRGALTLTCAGAYLKMEGGNIEMGCPGNIVLKGGQFQWRGANSLSVSLPAMPIGTCKECLLDALRGVEAMTEVA